MEIWYTAVYYVEEVDLMPLILNCFGQYRIYIFEINAFFDVLQFSTFQIISAKVFSILATHRIQDFHVVSKFFENFRAQGKKYRDEYVINFFFGAHFFTTH